MLTSLPASHMPSFDIGDKFNHFFAYLILGAMLYTALLAQNKYEKLKLKPFIYSLAIVSLYGLLDEVHQIFIPGRSAEFLDWLADFLGALSGISIIRYLLSRYKSKFSFIFGSIID